MGEYLAIKGAVELLGYQEGQVKISVVVCQKMHHTRLVYNDNGEIINPCPGLCADGSAEAQRSIVSATYNEFYLNSHYALQGTAKSCKYALIYDEIGIKVRIEHLYSCLTHLLNTLYDRYLNWRC